MLPPFSPIQNHILSKLKHAKSLRYSELQPKETANDLFNYHLQFLVKKEFVIRSEDGYTLSPKGEKHIADPLGAVDPLHNLFKINVITILSRIIDGKIEILNQVRHSNPSYGKVGVPGGVVQKGEIILVAAKRKLMEETGLRAEFRLVGVERRMMYKEGELFSDVLFPICYADTSSGKLIPETQFGANLWVPIKEAIKNESSSFDSIKSIVTVLTALKNGTIAKLPFFFGEVIQSDSR